MSKKKQGVLPHFPVAEDVTREKEEQRQSERQVLVFERGALLFHTPIFADQKPAELLASMELPAATPHVVLTRDAFKEHFPALDRQTLKIKDGQLVPLDTATPTA